MASLAHALEELHTSKPALRPTETTITHRDGRRSVECPDGSTRQLEAKAATCDKCHVLAYSCECPTPVVSEGAAAASPAAAPEEAWVEFGEKIRVRAEDPTGAWRFIQGKLPYLTAHPVDPESLTLAEGEGVRFVCISDTHGKFPPAPLPAGDVLLHAGDFTSTGGLGQTRAFAEWFGAQPHSVKIVIAGNHDVTLHQDYYQREWRRFHRKPVDAAECRRLTRDWGERAGARREDKVDNGRSWLVDHSAPSTSPAFPQVDVTAAQPSLIGPLSFPRRLCRHRVMREGNFIYLEDSSTIAHGYHIYGSPWQPEFCDWAFNLDRGASCAEAWAAIPTEAEVVITHGPALGQGDACKSGFRAGCVDLLQQLSQRVKPLVHVAGHIHEGYGVTSNGVTNFINASTCNFQYRPDQPPIVFDLPKKQPVEVSTQAEPGQLGAAAGAAADGVGAGDSTNGSGGAHDAEQSGLW